MQSMNTKFFRLCKIYWVKDITFKAASLINDARIYNWCMTHFGLKSNQEKKKKRVCFTLTILFSLDVEKVCFTLTILSSLDGEKVCFTQTILSSLGVEKVCFTLIFTT